MAVSRIIAPASFAQYRVRLIRLGEPIIGNLPRLLWRKPVFRKGDTGYKGESLVRRYGGQWPDVLAKVAADKSLEIFGSDDGRSWYSISTWRPSRASAPAKAVQNIGRRELVRDRMMNALAQMEKEPSRSVAAWHMHRQGLTRELIEKTMKDFGWDVTASSIRDYLKYGRQLERDGEPCPFDAFP